MGWTVQLSRVFFLLSVIIPQLQVLAQDVVNYRLPEIYSPSHYTVDIRLDRGVFNGNVTTFDGQSTILFNVLEETSAIIIHGVVIVNNLTLTDDNGTVITTTYTYNSLTELLTITANSNLTVNTAYTLGITYTGNFDLFDMRGFYRSEYTNANGSKVYLATTQFQPTHARKAFPCFDEPHYKARFNISLTYPSGLMALGNTPVVSTESVG